MKKQYSLGVLLVSVFAISLSLMASRVQPSPVNAAPPAAQAMSVDELSYSACNCIPPSNGSWGNNSSGLGFSLDGFWWDPDIGSWRYNERTGSNGNLYCPVAYDFRERLRPIEIRANVIDNNASDEVRVDVFGQTAAGNPVLLGTRNTSNPETGRRELTVTITPQADMRYLWLRVNIPNLASGGESGLIGYRVNRIN